MKRIESGLHGPTLLLEDDAEARMAWDDIEVEFYVDEDGLLSVVVYAPDSVERMYLDWDYKENR